MTPQALEQILASTLADGRLTRTERQALKARIEAWDPSPEARAEARAHVFDMARRALDQHPPAHVVSWVEEVFRVLVPMSEPTTSVAPSEAYFSPAEAGRKRIIELFGGCRTTAEVCVFTVTDNDVAQAILRAHERGVRVRIITDNLKAEDRGSDVDRLAAAGVPVRMDHTDAHMHHKFALFDGQRLLTGSYNWTRSAFLENHENIVLTEDRHLVRLFDAEFERLWHGPDTGPHPQAGESP